MRKSKLIIAVAMLSLGLVGCSSDKGKGPNSTSAIDKVLQQQTQQTDGANEGDLESDPVTSINPYLEQGDAFEPEQGTTEGIDYDLTTMSSDMVYAVVYQMMTDPDRYIGKTIRMDGTYNASYYEETSQYYHYVIIEDAAACCAQGIEFVWDDGSHVYPDDYPAQDSEVVVTGVFETYREEGDSNLYCHLKDATLEITKK